MNNTPSIIPQELRRARISGAQKAALLTIALNVETAAEIFKNLSHSDVELITTEISKVKNIPADTVEEILEEFYGMAAASEYVLEGGVDYAKKILEKSFGPQQAVEILDKIKNLTTLKGFEVLKKTDSSQLVSFLSREHPQTIALILAHIDPNQTADVIKELPEPTRTEVVYRIATLGKISPKMLEQIEVALNQMASLNLTQSAVSDVGGTKSLAQILNKTSVTLSKELLENLEKRNPDVASEVKRLMFMFDDLIKIQDKDIQKILRQVDRKDLALSLKIADDSLKEKIYANMSERAADLLKEELQYMGMVKLKDVEAAQAKIIDVVKDLEESGEITISSRGGSEEVYV